METLLRGDTPLRVLSVHPRTVRRGGGLFGSTNRKKGVCARAFKTKMNTLAAPPTGRVNEDESRSSQKKRRGIFPLSNCLRSAYGAPVGDVQSVRV